MILIFGVLFSSVGTVGSVKIPKMCEELRRLAMELKRIETIRCYVGEFCTISFANIAYLLNFVS